MTAIATGRFVWFEYVAPQPEKAQGFFGELFGWTTQSMPSPAGNYTMIAHGGTTIGGYPPFQDGAPKQPQWLTHLQVASAADSAARVKTLGGNVLMPATTISDHGTMAVVADPLGAPFALWQPGKPEGNGDFLGKPGSFCWNELWTSDAAKAVAFYKAIGGFTSEAMPMGETTYHVLNADGKPRAGAMTSPMPGVPNMWLPYVQVASADESVARATKLGASIKVPATDIPNVGRFSVFTDPLGAALGILQPG